MRLRRLAAMRPAIGDSRPCTSFGTWALGRRQVAWLTCRWLQCRRMSLGLTSWMRHGCLAGSLSRLQPSAPRSCTPALFVPRLTHRLGLTRATFHPAKGVPCTHSLTHSFTRSHTHSIAHSNTPSLTHSPTHSPTHSCSPHTIAFDGAGPVALLIAFNTSVSSSETSGGTRAVDAASCFYFWDDSSSSSSANSSASASSPPPPQPPFACAATAAANFTALLLQSPREPATQAPPTASADACGEQRAAAVGVLITGLLLLLLVCAAIAWLVVRRRRLPKELIPAPKLRSRKAFHNPAFQTDLRHSRAASRASTAGGVRQTDTRVSLSSSSLSQQQQQQQPLSSGRTSQASLLSFGSVGDGGVTPTNARSSSAGAGVVIEKILPKRKRALSATPQ